jgi:hypothetical protein
VFDFIRAEGSKNEEIGFNCRTRVNRFDELNRESFAINIDLKVNKSSIFFVPSFTKSCKNDSEKARERHGVINLSTFSMFC